jgi:hypothetical protein
LQNGVDAVVDGARWCRVQAYVAIIRKNAAPDKEHCVYIQMVAVSKRPASTHPSTRSPIPPTNGSAHLHEVDLVTVHRGRDLTVSQCIVEAMYPTRL